MSVRPELDHPHVHEIRIDWADLDVFEHINKRGLFQIHAISKNRIMPLPQVILGIEIPTLRALWWLLQNATF